MIDWLLTNKEWVFSGAGITVLVGLVAFFRLLGKKQKPEIPPVVVRIEHVLLGGSQPGLSTSTMVAINRITLITPEDIKTSIETAPLLQSKAVANRYKGLRVEWETELIGAEEDKGMVRLHLRVSCKKMLFPFFVWCDVKLADYPELSVLPKGACVKANGRIENATSDSVKLYDVCLTFLSPKMAPNSSIKSNKGIFLAPPFSAGH